MALVKGENSYCTVAEADAYHSDSLDSSWLTASAESKAASLIAATRVLDEINWIGTAVSDSQKLAFPRNCEYFETKLGVMVQNTNSTPKRVENACFELALHLLLNPSVLATSDDVAGVKVGDIEIGAIKKAPLIPVRILNTLNPLIRNGGSNTWWRAN